MLAGRVDPLRVNVPAVLAGAVVRPDEDRPALAVADDLAVGLAGFLQADSDPTGGPERSAGLIHALRVDPPRSGAQTHPRHDCPADAVGDQAPVGLVRGIRIDGQSVWLPDDIAEGRDALSVDPVVVAAIIPPDDDGPARAIGGDRGIPLHAGIDTERGVLGGIVRPDHGGRARDEARECDCEKPCRSHGFPPLFDGQPERTRRRWRIGSHGYLGSDT